MGLLASSATLAAAFPDVKSMAGPQPSAALAMLPTKGFLSPLQKHQVGTS